MIPHLSTYGGVHHPHHQTPPSFPPQPPNIRPQVSGGGALQPPIRQLLHPSLFTKPASVPNVLPRPLPIPPPLHTQQPNTSNDPFLEEQVELLAEKMEGLEGELRYAWRALDVLSQEYVKMWQRLEKMEGLLSEQQTVISQLIDLYSVDSSGSGNENLKDELSRPGSPPLLIPDENFYKALNQVHGEANSDMRLALSQDGSNDEEIESLNGVRPTYLPTESPKASKTGTFADFYNGESNSQDLIKKLSKKQSKKKKAETTDDDDYSEEMDGKSVTTSSRSTQSGQTHKSDEGIIDHPEEVCTSPGVYDNITPPPHPGPPKKLSKKTHRPEEKLRKYSSPVNGSSSSSKSEKVSKKKQDKIRHGSLPIGDGSYEEKEAALAMAALGGIHSDTYPRSSRKEGGPDEEIPHPGLTLIGGKYSFSLEDAREEELIENTIKGSKNKGMIANTSTTPVLGPTPSVSSSSSSNTAPPLPPKASVANGKPLFTSLQSTAMMKPSSSSAPNISINTSSSSSSSASNNNNKNISSQNIKALKQQLSNPLPLKQSSTEKTRKLSLKEKRKLRAERGIRELDIQSSSEGGGVTAPGQTNIPPGHPPLHSTTTTSTTTASTVSLRGKLDSSESDQSIRSDQSASSPKLELVPPLTPKKPQEQQQNDSSNGSNGRERSSSREFAVSRALGKYREKQKLTKEKGGSSNSDSQEELDLPYPTDIVSSLTSSILTEGESSSRKNSLKHQQQGINDTLKNLDAKLAKMEEVKPLIKGKKERGKLPKSKRQSTEDESIDKEDEWYKHEMKVLEEMEYEKEMEGIQPPQEIKTNMNLVLKELREKTPVLEKSICDRVEKDRLQLQFKSVADFSKTVLHSSMKRSNEFDEGTLDDEEEDDDIIDDDDDDTDSSHPAGALSSEDEEEDASDATQSGPDSLADSYDEVEDKRRKSKSGKSERKAAAHATTALQSGESGSAGSLSSHSKPSSSSSSSTPHRKSDGQQSPPSSTKVSPNEDSLSLTPTKEEEFEEQDVTTGEVVEENTEYQEEEEFTNGYYDENGEWIESTGYYDENGDWVETGGYYDENGVWIEYAGYYDDNGEWVNVEPNPPNVAHEYTEDEPGVTGVYPGIEEDSEPPDRGGNQEEEEVKETQFNESKSADHFLVEAGVAVIPPQGQTTPVANNHNEPPSTDPDNNFLHEDDKTNNNHQILIKEQDSEPTEFEERDDVNPQNPTLDPSDTTTKSGESKWGALGHTLKSRNTELYQESILNGSLGIRSF
ncbi:uncharacterized protein [Lepeophtheirus salmonis]|uniref:uncharacterized protein n=1 Tax=Lepeophtheirus salmonis TaxID=72036 RepID=UPI003AF3A3F9